MKTGVELIAEERQRQIEVEGWDIKHDDLHDQNQMALAAACYAIPAPSRSVLKRFWKWGWNWWKPTPDNRVRELQKAGALIAAEIDRLQRLKITP